MAIKLLHAILFLLCIMAIPFFGHLDHIPVQLWDESRLGVSALEMSVRGNWLIPTYDGLPDMWNTKPPLMIWLQVISFKCFGLNEVALRLPSALAAAFTCLLLFYVLACKIGSAWLGIIAATVLVTTGGYVTTHGMRTGDYDALLVLMMSASALSFFLYMEEPKKKYLYGTFIFLALAVLTKGIAGLLFTPALFIYSVYRLKTVTVLKQKHFYIGLLVFILFGLGYYLLREHYNHGYLKAINKNELAGRFGKANEGHEGDGRFYIHELMNYGYTYWYPCIPLGILTGLLNIDKRIKRLTVFCTIVALIHLIVISLSATKLEWYVLPCYPFFAVLTGIFIYTVFQVLTVSQLWKQVLTRNVLPFILLLCVFCKPYMDVVDSVTDPKALKGTNESEPMADFLKQVLHGQRNIDGATLVWDIYQAHLKWYYLIFTHQKRNISYTKSRNLRGNEKVVVYNSEMKQRITAKFQAVKLDSFQNVMVYQLEGIKK